EVLIGLEVLLGILVQDLAAQADRAVRALQRIAVGDFRAVGVDDALALRAYVRRHDELDRIAEHAADHRERDAGVARGGADDGFPRRELPAVDSLLDHLERRTVFDRATGVEAFELRENFHAGGDALGDPADLYERSVADEIEDGIDDLRLSEPFGGDPARCG